MTYENCTLGSLLIVPEISRIAKDAIRNRDLSQEDLWNKTLKQLREEHMLSQGNRVLIIDAKYYSHTTQQQFGINTLHSNNLYQVFTYVKNKEHELMDTPHTVSGMLLYARTDESIIPDNEYSMSGNTISVKALDLNTAFSSIAAQLNAIAESFFILAA